MTLPHGGGPPPLRGVLRAAPADFAVEELLSFEPCGRGEHLYLWIEKTGANTAWVAGQLARCAGVRRRAVGYAGRKDRHAVTRQWFSVHLPGHHDPDTTAWEVTGARVLRSTRHERKLRVGAVAANRFAIRVTAIEGEDREFDTRVARLRRYGAPNFFGPQRFGRDAHNLELARQLFAGARLRREDRSMALSAARAALFNAVLEERVRDDTWRQALPGDCLNLDGSRSFFLCEAVEDEVRARVAAGDLHPTGPLWGAGEAPSRDVVAALEQRVAGRFRDYVEGLGGAGMRHERRALRVLPRSLAVSLEQGVLTARFELPAGAYATTVLAELVSCQRSGQP